MAGVREEAVGPCRGSQYVKDGPDAQSLFTAVSKQVMAGQMSSNFIR